MQRYAWDEPYIDAPDLMLAYATVRFGNQKPYVNIYFIKKEIYENNDGNFFFIVDTSWNVVPHT